MAEGRRTIRREITQPAADRIRDIATDIECGKLALSDARVRQFAMDMGVPPTAPDVQRRLLIVLRSFADEIEKGEL